MVCPLAAPQPGPLGRRHESANSASSASTLTSYCSLSITNSPTNQPTPSCCDTIIANGIPVSPGNNPSTFPAACEGSFSQQPFVVVNGRTTYQNSGYLIFYTTSGQNSGSYWTCAANSESTTVTWLKGSIGGDCPIGESPPVGDYHVCTRTGGCSDANGYSWNGNYLYSVTCDGPTPSPTPSPTALATQRSHQSMARNGNGVVNQVPYITC